MPEYTLATLLSMAAVIIIELAWLRTGIFRRAQYWLAMMIVFAFQVLVDGWLTKLSNPIVIYDSDRMSGVRWPWDIPVEDFGFGFAMITLTLIVWQHGVNARRRRRVEPHEDERAERGGIGPGSTGPGGTGPGSTESASTVADGRGR